MTMGDDYREKDTFLETLFFYLVLKMTTGFGDTICTVVSLSWTLFIRQGIHYKKADIDSQLGVNKITDMRQNRGKNNDVNY